VYEPVRCRAARSTPVAPRLTRAYDALARPPVAPLQRQAPAAGPRRSGAEVVHRGRLPLLRTLAFKVAGALVFRLLLKRSFPLGTFAGFVVKLVQVGAAVVNRGPRRRPRRATGPAAR